MILPDASSTIEFGKQLARQLIPPAALELIGDIGAGKTTLVQGIALGLGIDDPVTSPSFVINKKYHGADNTVLSHYDFYRLPDPGLMSEELAESISDPSTITIIEWSDTVADVLPADRKIVRLRYLDDGTRELEIVQ